MLGKLIYEIKLIDNTTDLIFGSVYCLNNSIFIERN